MPDKCETCDGLGFVLAGNSMWRCSMCERYTIAEARARILLCCEAHDGLVEACVEGLRVLNTQHLGDHSVLAEMEAAIAKAKAVKEPT